MTTHGKLVVLEGPDGSGKTLLSKKLVRALARKGIKSRYLAFPGKQKGSLGALVYKLHHKPKTVGVHGLEPASLQVLHLAAHLDAIHSTILPKLRAGEWVILDRYWWSMWVYGICSGVSKSLLQNLVDCELDSWANTKAEIFLICRKAAKNRDGGALWHEYEKLAKSQPSECVIIHNDSTPDAAVGEIFSKINAGQQELPLRRTAPPPQLGPAKTTVVFDTYWRFAAERQEIFFRRISDPAGPWTNDTVLSDFKFTNAYRAADRVSQYLIKNVIYDKDRSIEETFFRIMLFKFFNRIDTWETLEKKFGEVSLNTFSIDQYDAALTQAMESGKRVYSAAYIMPTGGPNSRWKRKHRMHLELLAKMMRDELPARLTETRSMGQGFDLLRAYPTIGDFLGYQFITDLNYAKFLDYSEMEFTVPGPGAKDGIRKCFSDLGGLTEPEIIRLVAERQAVEFERLGIKFRNLFGRPLQLIDCQNLFCEVDKYARVMHPEFSGKTGRTRIKQRFSPSTGEIRYWFPPKWRINQGQGHEVARV